MNKVQLIGRTTAEIELRHTNGNKAVGRFTLAVNRRKKDDGADFITCIVWGKNAENAQRYVHKGSLIGVSGRWQTGSYEKNGQRVYTNECVVDEVEFIDLKGMHGNQAGNNHGFEPVNEDDVPY